MSYVKFFECGAADSMIWASFHRCYEGGRAGKWLITINSGLNELFFGRVGENSVQAGAVVDDFGSLVVVGGWL